MERVVDITFKNKSSHMSTCLTMVGILDSIYKNKKPDDIVILSAGHGGLAMYVMLEKYMSNVNAEHLYMKHGVHPHRDVENGIHVSTGSLGSGILVAVGYAVANRSRDVHVVLTDGECAEGSVWEALAFAHTHKLKNLKVHVNVNGYSAYGSVDKLYIWLRLKSFLWSTRVWFTETPNVSFLKGLQGHYHVMNEGNKEEIIKYINEEGVRKQSLRIYEEGLKNFLDYCRSWVWRP